MNFGKRPLSLTILACVYIAVGTVGFVYHFGDFQTKHVFQNDAVWIELTEILAVVSGVFMLRGNEWARWLAFTWMAFHVVLSFYEFSKFAVHCLLCAFIGWCLFRPEATRYFRSARFKPT